MFYLFQTLMILHERLFVKNGYLPIISPSDDKLAGLVEFAIVDWSSAPVLYDGVPKDCLHALVHGTT